MIEKEHVARCFKASSATYEEHAVVQKEMSHELVSLLLQHNHESYSKVLEIGCCTGVLTEQLCRNLTMETLIVNDLVTDFCSLTKERVQNLAAQIETFPGDIESLILPRHLDLVVSSATFQWINDFPGLLQRFSSALQPNGWLAFSIFSPGTMQEISQLTGRGLQYIENDELVTMVAKYFQVAVTQVRKHVLFFPGVRAVLRHIRQTGVGGVGHPRWTATAFRRFEKEYINRFSSSNGVPVTYVATHIIAKVKT